MDSTPIPNERSSIQSLGSSLERFYSPKAVAKAIGVSESSMKRWCDSGKITAMKTAGGHRRLRQSQVISFLRERKKYELLDPLSIGLPDLSEVSVADLGDAAKQFEQNLVAEAPEKCHRLLTFLYVNGWSMENIVDQVVSVAFKSIGTRWQHGSLEIYQERRACEICIESFVKMKSILNPPAPDAPTAIGGTVEKDNYTLTTKGIEITLASHGWNATSLGSSLPLPSMLQAALTKRPNLMWLSVSYLEDENAFIRDFNLMSEQIPGSTTLVVGGFAIKPWFWSKLKNAIYCDSFSQLIGATKKLAHPSKPFNSP